MGLGVTQGRARRRGAFWTLLAGSEKNGHEGKFWRKKSATTTAIAEEAEQDCVLGRRLAILALPQLGQLQPGAEPTDASGCQSLMNPSLVRGECPMTYLPAP